MITGFSLLSATWSNCTAELRDGVLVDITQADTAENGTASPCSDDNFEWPCTEDLSTWQHFTVHPVDDDPALPRTKPGVLQSKRGAGLRDTMFARQPPQVG